MKSKQYAALPFRRNQNRLEVLLITTRNKGRWSVPKGWPIERTTPHGTAAIEAFEEAGLLGKIAPVEVGRFKHRKLRKKQEVKCEVRIFPLKVTNQEFGLAREGAAAPALGLALCRGSTGPQAGAQKGNRKPRS